MSDKGLYYPAQPDHRSISPDGGNVEDGGQGSTPSINVMVENIAASTTVESFRDAMHDPLALVVECETFEEGIRQFERMAFHSHEHDVSTKDRLYGQKLMNASFQFH